MTEQDVTSSQTIPNRRNGRAFQTFNCKESFIARPYSQINIQEESAMIRIKHNDQEFDCPSKAKVKYWDPNVEQMVAGPIVVPISQGWPISTYTLERLASRESLRIMED